MSLMILRIHKQKKKKKCETFSFGISIVLDESDNYKRCFLNIINIVTRQTSLWTEIVCNKLQALYFSTRNYKIKIYISLIDYENVVQQLPVKYHALMYKMTISYDKNKQVLKYTLFFI